MKILMINSVCGIKSTGRVCTDLAVELEKRGHIVRIAYGREDVPEQYSRFAYRIGNNQDVYLHGCYARIFDATGHGSRKVTQKFVAWAEEFNPDVIHLHNIHGYYVNIPILFDYLRQSQKRIVWTLHDCWPFTGHCCYFDFANCSKWKEQCCRCPQKHDYPASIVLDRSLANYRKKKKMFSGIDGMTLVAPSKWLADLTKESFLCEYPVYTIPNWVDVDAFSNDPNDFKYRHKIDRQYIVLGVASVWDRRKGLEVFVKLERILGEQYQIVLVGLSKEQMKQLPQGIIGINHTSSKRELSEIYSAADVLVNPTHEDNYPATHLEAIACGTPVVSFDVGGCSESANLYGTVVSENDITGLADAIRKISKGEAKLSRPDMDVFSRKSFEQYFQLLESGV